MLEWEGLPERVYQRLLDGVGKDIVGILETTRQTVQDDIERGLLEGLGAAQLGDLIEASSGFSELRAETIARTETATMLNNAAVESYREFGITHVTVIDGDGDPECAEADGQTWTLEEAEANPIGHPNCVRDFAPIVGRDAESDLAPPTAEPSTEPLSLREAQDRLFAIDVQSNLEGLDPALFGPLTETLEALQKQYPEVFEAIHVSVTMSDYINPRAYASTGTAQYNGVPRLNGLLRGQADIQLNSSLWRDLSKFAQQLQSDHAGGWLGGPTPQYVLEHEFGHILDVAHGSDPDTRFSLGDWSVLAPHSPTEYAKSAAEERFAEIFAMLRNGADLSGGDVDAIRKLMGL